MKRFVVIGRNAPPTGGYRLPHLLGLMLGAAFFIAGCDLFEGDNEIQYPVIFRYFETPGKPITLTFYIDFFDETPDSSGVLSDTGRSNDTLWFIIKPLRGDEDQGSFSNRLLYDMDTLVNGTYKLLFEGKLGKRESFDLSVSDTTYVLADGFGEVAEYWGPTTLYRIYPGMLLLEAGLKKGQSSSLDALKAGLASIGASTYSPYVGVYSIFEVDSTGRVYGDRETSDKWAIYGNFEITTSLLYIFTGDTMRLDSLYSAYKDTSTISALSLRMGNGFDSYNWE